MRVLLLMAVLVFVSCGKQEQVSPAPSPLSPAAQPVPVVVEAPKPPDLVKPKPTVTPSLRVTSEVETATLHLGETHHARSLAIKVSNQSDNPIEVKRVVFNGKDEAKTCEKVDASLMMQWKNGSDHGSVFVVDGQEMATKRRVGGRELPATLQIGESVLFFVRAEQNDYIREYENYSKDVVYLDVETSLGSVRFEPPESGFGKPRDWKPKK